MQKRAEKGRKQQRKTKEKQEQVAGNGQRQNRKKDKEIATKRLQERMENQREGRNQ